MMNGFILADIASTELTAEDFEVLTHPHIVGVVLFSRNYENPTQLNALTTSLKKMNPKCIIAVDQEGGRVQRFRSHFTTLPSMRYFGTLYQENTANCQQKMHEFIATMISELKAVGVNFNLLPVLDLDRGLNKVIGERSFSHDPRLVTVLGEMLIRAVHQNQMPVLGKHFPGHGGVSLDSHEALPIDTRDFETLEKEDMQPFIQLLSQLDAIMPAHVVYQQIDPMPTTYSTFWLRDILRQRLGFSGVVVSDDLTMAGAAKIGGYADRALAAQEAGCDILTVCNNRAGLIRILDEPALKAKMDSTKRIQCLWQKIEGRWH